MTTSAILGIPYISGQQAQPDVTHNQAISLLQIMHAGGAITVGENTPPGSPDEGDVYVVGETPTGVWAGHENAIVGFFLSQWLFIPGNDSNGTPIVMGPDQEGLRIWSKTDDAIFIWTDLGVSPGVLVWQVLPSNITTLALLLDTNVTSPQENDLLTFKSGFWQNVDPISIVPHGLLSLQGNATETVISVAGTGVLIAGTWVIEDLNLMTGTTAGRFTDVSTNTIVLDLTGSFTVEPVSGGAVDISIVAAIDGTAVPNSKRTASASAGNPASITVPWQADLVLNDFVEWFVINEDTTVNVIVSSAVSRLK